MEIIIGYQEMQATSKAVKLQSTVVVKVRGREGVRGVYSKIKNMQVFINTAWNANCGLNSSSCETRKRRRCNIYNSFLYVRMVVLEQPNSYPKVSFGR